MQDLATHLAPAAPRPRVASALSGMTGSHFFATPSVHSKYFKTYETCLKPQKTDKNTDKKTPLFSQALGADRAHPDAAGAEAVGAHGDRGHAQPAPPALHPAPQRHRAAETG